MKIIRLILITLFFSNFTNSIAQKLTKESHRIEISPLFFGPPTHEYPFEEEMTEEKLSRILDNMKNDGFNTVLIVGSIGEKAYYPSKVLKDPCKIDWYNITFEMALERNMQVALSGISYTYNNQFTGGTWDPNLDLVMNKKIFTELNQRYGHYSNFWGWYIPHETGDRTHRGNIMVILKELPQFLKKLTPDKTVSFSPWFPSRITLGDAEALSPAQTAAEWDTILSEVDGIDLYLFQDSTAPLDELAEYFAAIKPVFDKHNVELGAVIELFIRFQDKPGIDLFHSISPEILFKKMQSITPYTLRFACWEYQTHLDPDSKIPGAKELNEAYNSWLNTLSDY
jgi:hypothetical protein